jgi:ribosomal protein L37AE/L43A
MRYHAVDAPMNAVLRNPNPCAQCGELFIAARWSEHLSERCVRHVWECDACGYQFETAIYLSADMATEQQRRAAGLLDGFS